MNTEKPNGMAPNKKKAREENMLYTARWFYNIQIFLQLFWNI
jgi:hypothetical protein